MSCSADSDLEGAVVEVIDHHLLEREPSPSCPVTVETVGSCATLVAERIIQKAPHILDQQLAQLLYGERLLSRRQVTDRCLQVFYRCVTVCVCSGRGAGLCEHGSGRR